MILALLRKQFLESVAFLLFNKEGKRRNLGGIIGFAALLLMGLASFRFIFYEICYMLCGVFVAQGLTWLYFAFIGVMSTAFGVIGSIFMTKTKLYEAKDNDLLFSMPIPSWLVLFSRTLGLYFFTLLFETLVFAPSVVCYFVVVGFSAKVLFGSLLTLLVMPLGTLAICLILGWALAVIAAKFPAKNLFTMIFTIGFTVLYFVGYSKINDLLTYVMENGGAVAGAMQTWLFPFWKMGQASGGDFLALLWYTLLFAGSFALVYFVVSVTYLRLATANKGGKKRKYISKEGKQGSALTALLKKELLRVFKNPMVALNCCLGTAFGFVLPFLLAFSPDMKQLFSMLGGGEVVAMILGALLCTLTSMNAFAACAVSLEGENLWIARSLPLSTEKILLAKAATHFVLISIPTLFASIFLSVLFKLAFGFALLLCLATLVFCAMGSFFGLFINLLLPNLHWTNEVVCVKQSVSVVLFMFAQWAIVGLLVGGYFLFGKYLFVGGYLLFVIAFLLLLTALLAAWLTTFGKRIFEGL